MTDDEIRAQLMGELEHAFVKVLQRPDGAEYARRFLDGRVNFLVTNTGIRVLDLTATGIDPKAN